MATNPIVKRFTQALGKFEASGDIDALVGLFSDEAELSTLAMGAPFRGKAGVYRFWRDYRSLFGKVETDFTRITPGNSFAALEWASRGAFPSGKPFSYVGVTLLEWEGDRIIRLKAFYDSAIFVQQSAKHMVA